VDWEGKGTRRAKYSALAIDDFGEGFSAFAFEVIFFT
jgi:hypothetical protein